MKKGDRYKIRNFKISEDKPEEIIEGTATLRKPVNGRGRWMVEFDDEPDQLYPRTVYPADKVE